MDDEVLRYPVELVRDGHGSVFALFPDVPKVLTFGSSESEALRNASHSLRAALDELLLSGKPLPKPSPAKESVAVNVRRSELWRHGVQVGRR